MQNIWGIFVCLKYSPWEKKHIFLNIVCLIRSDLQPTLFQVVSICSDTIQFKKKIFTRMLSPKFKKYRIKVKHETADSIY